MYQQAKLRKISEIFMISSENNMTSLVPEKIAANYASLSRRFAALLIDCILLGILSFICGLIIPFLGSVLAWFFYSPILESSEIRGTVGKNLMGIQVTDLMGRRISLRSALIRNLMKIVSGAIAFIGFFFAFFSRQKQTLHDHLAETIVVYGRSNVPITEAWVETSKDAFRAGKEKFESTSANLNSDSLVAQLERLQVLRNQNVINEDEFQAAKKKILR